MRSIWVHHTCNKRTSIHHYCLVNCYSSCTSLILSAVLSVVLYVSFTSKLIIIFVSFALFSVFTPNNASTSSWATSKVTFFFVLIFVTVTNISWALTIHSFAMATFPQTLVSYIFPLFSGSTLFSHKFLIWMMSYLPNILQSSEAVYTSATGFTHSLKFLENTSSPWISLNSCFCSLQKSCISLLLIFF